MGKIDWTNYRGTPIHLAQYDRTGYGEIDSEKTRELEELLKSDPGGASKIASYTNQAIGESMIGHSFIQGMPTDTPNMVARAQDKYLQEMRGLRGAKQSLRMIGG